MIGICVSVVLLIFVFFICVFLRKRYYNCEEDRNLSKNTEQFINNHNDSHMIQSHILFFHDIQSVFQLNFMNYELSKDIDLSWSHFDFFWHIIINPVINNIFNSMEVEFKKDCNVQLKDLTSYKMELEHIYKIKRNWLKRIYLPHRVSGEESEKEILLDFHKLSSVLIRSVLANKPITMNLKSVDKYTREKFDDQNDHTTWFVNNVYCNYKIALYIGLGILYIDTVFSVLYQHTDFNYIEYRESLSTDERKNINSNIVDVAKKITHLATYPERTTHENFINSLILGLVKNDLRGRSFDYLGYAALLFQLQEYNLLLLKEGDFDTAEKI